MMVISLGHKMYYTHLMSNLDSYDLRNSHYYHMAIYHPVGYIGAAEINSMQNQRLMNPTHF